ncbi:hypothetical protein Rs2_24013 [Raphanus sativus]|nr:hypothetical protein Rs2_24013 [Raphanus sativus]
MAEITRKYMYSFQFTRESFDQSIYIYKEKLTLFSSRHVINSLKLDSTRVPDSLCAAFHLVLVNWAFLLLRVWAYILVLGMARWRVIPVDLICVLVEAVVFFHQSAVRCRMSFSETVLCMLHGSSLMVLISTTSSLMSSFNPKSEISGYKYV